MGSEQQASIASLLTWLLYAAAGFGALSYGFFLQTKRNLRAFEVKHGLLETAGTFNPRDTLLRKLHGIESLRGLAIVVMLIGFLYWPVLFIGVLLFFFQTNAWKSTQRDLFALDRDHPEYKQAHQNSLRALGEQAQQRHQTLEQRGGMWQRLFAITMTCALLVACGLLVISFS